MRNFKGLAALVMVLGTAGLASAQAEHGGIPQVEFAVSYSYMRANASPGNCGCFNLNGGSAEVAVRTYRNLSAVFDMTGVYAAATSIPGQSLGLLSFTGGPRFSVSVLSFHPGQQRVSNRCPLRISGHLLAGSKRLERCGPGGSWRCSRAAVPGCG